MICLITMENAEMGYSEETGLDTNIPLKDILK